MYITGFKLNGDYESVKFSLNWMLFLLILAVWINNIVIGAVQLKKKFSKFWIGSVVVSSAAVLAAICLAYALPGNTSVQLGELMFACTFRHVNQTFTALSEILPIQNTSPSASERSPVRNSPTERSQVAETPVPPTLAAVASTSKSRFITDTIQQAIRTAIENASPKIGVLDIDTSSVPYAKYGRHVFDTRIYTFTNAGELRSDAYTSAISDPVEDPSASVEATLQPPTVPTLPAATDAVSSAVG